MKSLEQLGLSKLAGTQFWYNMKHNSKKFLQCLVPCRNLQASSERFGPRRANCKFFLATCKKTKYTGMIRPYKIEIQITTGDESEFAIIR